MLRYYERLGLVEPQRALNGYRDYDAAAEETVTRIRMLGAAGLTLETIRRILPCVRGGQPSFEPCDELRGLLRRQVEMIETRINALDQSRRILARYLGSLPADDASSRPPMSSTRPI